MWPAEILLLHQLGKEFGWRMHRPTPEKRYFGGYFKDIDNVRWDIKRNPQGRYRLRYVREKRITFVRGGGTMMIPAWHWWHGAPVFDHPLAAVLWFEKVGKTLLKYRIPI